MINRLLSVLIVSLSFGLLYSQPAYDYSKPFVCTSQLGFAPASIKEVSFFGGADVKRLPDEIPFYIQGEGSRLVRDKKAPVAWGKNVFRYPIDIGKGNIVDPNTNDKSFIDQPVYKGLLKKKITRWGVVWQADFSEFIRPGIYQIETQYGFSVPFMINDKPFERLEKGYLEFIYSQRSGVEIPAIRPVENADDALFYNDSTRYLPVAGGWNDAGDFRKWMFLTLDNIEALAQIATHGHPAFKEKAIQEMEWGNRYFHHMINDEGRVYEDVGGGYNRAGDYETTWWNENHPGVTAGGERIPDNIPLNGDERHIRDNYNPFVQFKFIRNQAIASQTMPHPYKSNCLVLADRAWKYSQSVAHDNRTIYIAEELIAAVELYKAGSKSVSIEKIERLVSVLLKRQETGALPLSGYFYEKDNVDGYRSVAFPAEPAHALLRMLESGIPLSSALVDEANQALIRYIDKYLIEDGKSNPFGIPPYGIYINPPFPKDQAFRWAGKGRYVRTFIHLFAKDPMPHGVNAGFLNQAYLMARAGRYMKRQDWLHQSEKILQWSLGHNTVGLCLFTDIGFRHPLQANFVNYHIPYSPLVGFLGRPDDTPYIETSNATEWSTQEIWDVPFYNTIGVITYLNNIK